MSPEYALEGIFSIKSDVFSFGVLLLEILSSKKNTGFYLTDSFNLLGYVSNKKPHSIYVIWCFLYLSLSPSFVEMFSIYFESNFVYFFLRHGLYGQATGYYN